MTLNRIQRRRQRKGRQSRYHRVSEIKVGQRFHHRGPGDGESAVPGVQLDVGRGGQRVGLGLGRWSAVQGEDGDESQDGQNAEGYGGTTG